MWSQSGFYSKFKWVNGLVDLGFEAIGPLRSDANLKFFYDGPQKGPNRPRPYDGKVDLTDPSRLTFVQTLDDGGSLYTAVVWSVNFQRPIRLAYLLKEQDGPRSYVVLFSTDVDIDPLHLYRCYSARFQIEFIFRSGPVSLLASLTVRLALLKPSIPMSMPASWLSI